MVKPDFKARMNDVTDTFNARLKDWYVNALQDHEITGAGEGKFLVNAQEVITDAGCYDFALSYVENGQGYVALYQVYATHLMENKVDWLFDIWAEGLFETKRVGEDKKLTRKDILELYAA